MTSPNVILVGAAGAGKTTVGRALAQSLDVAFHDANWACEQLFNSSFDSLMVEREREMAARAVEGSTNLLLETPGVVSLPPSAANSAQLLHAIKAVRVPVVMLTAPLDDLYRQAGLNVARPLGMGPIRAMFSQMERQITESYLSLHPLVIDTAKTPTEQAVREIETAMALQ